MHLTFFNAKRQIKTKLVLVVCTCFVLHSCNNTPSTTVTPENNNDVNNATDVNLEANPTIINKIELPESLTQLKDNAAVGTGDTPSKESVQAASDIPPKVVSLNSFPGQEVLAGESLSFTVEASPENELEYIWTVSDGQLLQNSGKTVTWKALGADGAPLKVSRAIVSVLVKDKLGRTDKHDMNILVTQNIQNTASSQSTVNYVSVPKNSLGVNLPKTSQSPWVSVSASGDIENFQIDGILEQGLPVLAVRFGQTTGSKTIQYQEDDKPLESIPDDNCDYRGCVYILRNFTKATVIDGEVRIQLQAHFGQQYVQEVQNLSSFQIQ